jgi:regulator of replication initiation timing
MNANQRLNHISLLARLLKQGSYEQNVYDAAELIDADTVEISREIQYTDEAAGVMSNAIGDLREEIDGLRERNRLLEGSKESLQRQLDDMKHLWAKADSDRIRAREALGEIDRIVAAVHQDGRDLNEIRRQAQLGLKYSGE